MTDEPSVGVIFTAVLIMGLLPAWIAHRKGYNFYRWWFYGAALFLLALISALLISPNSRVRRRCPSCREWIDRQASVCSRCGRDVSPERGSAELTGMAALVEKQPPLPPRDNAERPPDVVPMWLMVALSVGTAAVLGFTVWVFT